MALDIISLKSTKLLTAVKFRGKPHHSGIGVRCYSCVNSENDNTREDKTDSGEGRA
ncbi:uncharacterized protein RSE6_09972 [Rhynchosporium secalis]|uniref:Uncharacterized protein n=1 Tax=Rhynchosporium secalis TaxID=38038 RepID=A0A1E1MJ84_RHYSE|nr:uncharacterized protein RSE6_09972 [Rhynchosporium secalis]